MKTEIVRARVNPALKHEVECVLKHLGLSMSEAIVLYLSQIKLRNGIPFEVHIPNKITKKTLEAADAGKNLHKAKDLNDLFDQLEG